MPHIIRINAQRQLSLIPDNGLRAGPAEISLDITVHPDGFFRFCPNSNLLIVQEADQTLENCCLYSINLNLKNPKGRSQAEAIELLTSFSTEGTDYQSTIEFAYISNVGQQIILLTSTVIIIIDKPQHNRQPQIYNRPQNFRGPYSRMLAEFLKNGIVLHTISIDPGTGQQIQIGWELTGFRGILQQAIRPDSQRGLEFFQSDSTNIQRHPTLQGTRTIPSELWDYIATQGFLVPQVTVVPGSQCTFFLTASNDVFACGNNLDGQLGLGHRRYCRTATLLSHPAWANDPVVKIIPSHGHTCFQTRSHQIFMCGSNDSGNGFGHLGVGDESLYLTPTLLSHAAWANDPVVNIIPNPLHTFFKTRSGEIFTCGNNQNGEIGLPYLQLISTPTLLVNPDWGNDPVIEIVSRPRHTLFQTYSGRVFVCGSNQHGEIGLDAQQNSTLTLLAPPDWANDPVVKIASSRSHTAFLNHSGRIFVCGYNAHGQLGLGDEHNRVIPTLLPNPGGENNRVIEIVSSDSHTLFLTQNGQIFACGDNRLGQLGLGDQIDRSTPTLLSYSAWGNDPVVKIVAKFGLTFFKTRSRRIFACGNNQDGQLGLPGQANSLTPTLLTHPHWVNDPVVDFTPYSKHTIFRTRSGQIFVCGNNRYGQLGLGNEARHCPLSTLELF